MGSLAYTGFKRSLMMAWYHWNIHTYPHVDLTIFLSWASGPIPVAVLLFPVQGLVCETRASGGMDFLLPFMVLIIKPSFPSGSRFYMVENKRVATSFFGPIRAACQYTPGDL